MGDTLLEVGGTPVEGLSLSKVERMVRQTKSKALSLLVEREEVSWGLLPNVSNTEKDAKSNNVEGHKKMSNAEQTRTSLPAENKFQYLSGRGQ